MRGVSTIIVAILLTVIATAAATAAYYWAVPRLSLSFDIGEIQSVQSAMEACDAKILETARTGTGNRCLIPASRGILTAHEDGLYYTIVSDGQMCDQTLDWVSIVPEKHIELSCNTSSEDAIFGLRWRYPKTLNITALTIDGTVSRYSESYDMDFTPEPPAQMRTVSIFIYLVQEAGTSGKNVELNRRQLTADNVTLGVRIY